MDLTRRTVLKALPVAALSGFAGCSSTNSSRPIAIVVYTNSERQHSVNLKIEKGDEVLVTQDLLVPPYGPDPDPISTTINEIPVSKGERLNAIGTLDGSNQTVNTPLTLDCSDEADADLLLARITSSQDLVLKDSCNKEKYS